ncbi:MAG TPA: Mov34/MPN/PAD-1 family protein [Steroidobacter sp.]|uniref:Mov34/MPN/PAD-1 family protein n=1 Tax=Steroidobacter sp. TaxID=1978227 RepID=UPI002ED8C34D
MELSIDVLKHLAAHKQTRWWDREAGGQLFAILDQPSLVRIVDISGPRPTDRRSRNNYEPDRAAEKREIKERYAIGRHFVGDWHTHRQCVPHPSGTDEHSIQELVRNSSHDLAGFFLVIVGQAEFPNGLYLAFHGVLGKAVLAPEPSGAGL